MDPQLILRSTELIVPEIVLILTSLVLIVIGPFLKEKTDNTVFFISITGIIISFLLNIKRFNNPELAFSGSLSLDQFTAFFNSIFLFGALLTTILSKDYLDKESRNKVEYFALILLSTVGMMFLSASKELITLFLSFEIMSISVYILTAFNTGSAKSTESGIKYLVLGGFSSAILLYGMAILYGASGSIYLDQIFSSYDVNNPLYLGGTILVLAGFIFKIGAFPLHQWVPDIYQGAPLPITSFMSVAVKAAGFSILIRTIFEAFPYADIGIENVILIISILTMTVGNIAAIVQRSIKRMLAYSSIAHAGYALIGISAMVSGEEIGISTVLYYLYAYTLMNLGAFGILIYLTKDTNDIEDFDRISGLWDRKPLLAVALGIFMFSLAGIPPTIGFFAKYRIFLAAVNANLYLLAIIGIINSVISAYYYLKVLVYSFMRLDIYASPKDKPLSGFAIYILALATLLLGIFPIYSWNLASKAAESIMVTLM